MVNGGKCFATQQLFFEGLNAGALAERFGCTYHIGDKVKDERTDGRIDDVLVCAVVEAAAPGAEVLRRTPATAASPI